MPCAHGYDLQLGVEIDQDKCLTCLNHHHISVISVAKNMS